MVKTIKIIKENEQHLTDHLDDYKNVDILLKQKFKPEFLNRVDEIIYFTVFDDGKVSSYSNTNTLYGVKPFFRHIRCNYIDPSEFNG